MSTTNCRNASKRSSSASTARRTRGGWMLTSDDLALTRAASRLTRQDTRPAPTATDLCDRSSSDAGVETVMTRSTLHSSKTHLTLTAQPSRWMIAANSPSVTSHGSSLQRGKGAMHLRDLWGRLTRKRGTFTCLGSGSGVAFSMAVPAGCQFRVAGRGRWQGARCLRG